MGCDTMLILGEAAGPGISSRVGVRREQGGIEPSDERPRVALVPRRGEHDHRLTFPCQREQRIRHGERLEQAQALAVVDRARRHLLRPPALRCPLWVRRLPV
jgi:hypothetical protein